MLKIEDLDPNPVLVIMILILTSLMIESYAACSLPGKCGKWVVTYHPHETDFLADSSSDELMKNA